MTTDPRSGAATPPAAPAAAPAAAMPTTPVTPPLPQPPGARQPASEPAPLTRVPWAAVVVFSVIAMGLAWLAMLPMWLLIGSNPTSLSMTEQLLAQLLPTVMMFTPAIAMLVVVFFMKVPRAGRARFLGLWPLSPAKRVVWFIVLGNFGPIALVILALLVATAFGWFTPDFANLSGFTASLVASGVSAESVGSLLVVQLALIPIAGILNILPAFGEEIGWRGWLLPALRPLGTWPALLVSGAIWGLWHTPVTLLGHNFGFYDWRGVVLMTVGCVFLGVLFGWLRLRSGSVWPAAVAHGAFNGAAGTFGIFAMAGAPLSMPLVNPLGVSGWIAAAIIIVLLLATKQFGKEPALAPPRR